MVNLPNGNACNIANNFYDHQIIFDITYARVGMNLMIAFAVTGLAQSTRLTDVQEPAHRKLQMIQMLLLIHIGEFPV